jgi:hypothetical protein
VEHEGERATVLVDDTGVIEVTHMKDEDVVEERMFLYNTSQSTITTDDNAGGGWTITTPPSIEDGDKRKISIKGINIETAETPTITYSDDTVVIDSLYFVKWECVRAESGS